MNLINKKDLRNLQIRKLTEFGKTKQKQLEDEIKEKHANVTWAQLFYNTSEELVKNYIKNEKNNTFHILLPFYNNLIAK